MGKLHTYTGPHTIYQDTLYDMSELHHPYVYASMYMKIHVCSTLEEGKV